jgi:hypothetical protein
MGQKWVFPLDTQHIADAAAYASSTTLTDVSPLPNIVVPGLFLLPGMMVKIKAYAKFSNTGTPTLLLGFYYGGVAGVALAATSAITTTTGATNWPIYLEWEGRIRKNGASGTVMGGGWIDLGTSLTSVTHRPIPETAAAEVAIDTTVAKALTLGAQWSASSASNTLTCANFTVEISG